MRWWHSAETRKSIAQFIRYGVVGLSTNAIGYLFYLGLTYWGMGSKLAMTMMYCLGMVFGFLFNRKWTFSGGGDAMSAGTRYLAVYGLGYLLNLGILVMLVDWLGYYQAYVQAASIFVVAAFIFLLFKFFVFPDREA